MTEIKIDYTLNKKAKREHYLHNPRTCCVGHNFTFLPKECRVRSLDLRQNIKRVKMEIGITTPRKFHNQETVSIKHIIDYTNVVLHSAL